VGQPWDADTGAFAEVDTVGSDELDDPDHLMSGNDETMFGDKVPLGQMEVGATHSAHLDPHPELPSSGKWFLPSDALQGMAVHRPW